MERLQHTANLAIATYCQFIDGYTPYHPQALSLTEFSDQPIKGMVNSAV
jgi:hypothetical protein